MRTDNGTAGERRKPGPRAKGARRLKLADILVDREFAGLVPPPAPAEQARIDERLFQEGCREPLVVWNCRGRLILLVGYERLPALRRCDLPFTVVEREFSVREHARLFIIKHHLARPNLSPLEISYLQGLRYVDLKQAPGGDRKSPAAPLPVGKTAEALAEIFCESPAAIRRAGALVAAVKRIVADFGPDVMPLLFSRKAKLSRQTVLALSRLEPARLRRMIGQLRINGKLPRSWRGVPSTTITLPREPLALARALRARFGRVWLADFGEKVQEVLSEKAAPA